MREIQKATNSDFARFFKMEPPSDWMGKVMKKGRLVVAIAGVVKAHDGRYYGFMDLGSDARKPLIFRRAIKMIQETSEVMGFKELFVNCDKRYDRAEEFLLRLGFTETDETLQNLKVFKWQA